MSETKRQIMLVILDGWGYSEEKEHNAIAQANTPFFDSLWQTYSPTLLDASGEKVGLPEGQMGNSEIGHMTIGAGCAIDTDLVRISKTAKNEAFAENPAIKTLFDHILKNDSTLHIQGLIGPGGIHSHSDHLYAFLKSAKKYGLTKIAIHAFTDGRDTPPQSAAHYLRELETLLENLGIGYIATAGGRFYAMDRDNNWDRVDQAEKALFAKVGQEIHNKKPSQAYAELYEKGIFDEMAEPMIFIEDGRESYPIQENDGVFFFNFRADRARMISKKILDHMKPMNLCFVTMTEYDKSFDCLVAFPAIKIETTLAHQVSLAELTQAHIAETEKFAHATYFLNCGEEKPHPGEEHILVESYKDIKTHDQKPKMRAETIADKTIEQINKGTDFIFVNFANADMIGHTANVPALIEALEEVDKQLKRITEALIAKGGIAFITADHGNAETNFDKTSNQKHTAHTLNLVPAILTTNDYELKQGGLSDIAPTILSLFNIKQPTCMTGHSLLEEPNIYDK